MTEQTETENMEETVDIVEPIIINLGKQKKKDIKKLLDEREGKLMGEVMEVVNLVKGELKDQFEGQDGPVFVPIVLVYKKKDSDSIGILGL